MKIVRRDVNILSEELVMENLAELEALDICEGLNDANDVEGVYYLVVLDNHVVNNLNR